MKRLLTALIATAALRGSGRRVRARRPRVASPLALREGQRDGREPREPVRRGVRLDRAEREARHGHVRRDGHDRLDEGDDAYRHARHARVRTVDRGADDDRRDGVEHPSPHADRQDVQVDADGRHDDERVLRSRHRHRRRRAASLTGKTAKAWLVQRSDGSVKGAVFAGSREARSLSLFAVGERHAKHAAGCDH